MNKFKFLISIIAALLISNGILVYNLLLNQREKGGPKKLIIELLDFDSIQIEQYDSLIQLHRQAVTKNDLIINNSRLDLYKLLNQKGHTSKVDSIMFAIGQQQTVSEEINYQHFLDIKKLCKPHQLDKYKVFTMQIPQLFHYDERK